jgi:hypothetical protein
MTTRQINTEARPLLQNPYHSTGKKRWLAASVTSFLGTGGATYVSVKSFISGAIVNGTILGFVTVVCAGSCIYCAYRFINALRTRTIEPVTPVFDEGAAKANILMLQSIDSRLHVLLNETVEIDLNERLDVTGLHNSINQHLADLEQMLPEMRHELAEFKVLIQAATENRSIGSTNSSAYNSPSVDGSFEGKLLSRLTDLQNKVGKDQSSRNASRLQSAFSSPTVLSSSSRIISPTTERDISPIKKLRLDFTINDSDDSSKETKTYS